MAHEKEIADMRANMGAASIEEIERLKAEHTEHLKELMQKHEKLIADLNGKFDRQLAQKEQDHSDTILQIEKAHEEAIEREKELQANLEDQITALKEKIQSLENELSQTQT